ncbi:MAG: OB-fold nucleic acid binding domain-containing protein [Acidimicrobiales bacterium]|nr:OB-fold nucleic acid binding domain-containing protein [Acidimicrobiales bacterium]
MALFRRREREAEARRLAATKAAYEELGQVALRGVEPIGGVRWRQHVKVAGRVRAMRVQPWAEVASLELTIADRTGGLTVVFLGRRQIAGVRLGARIVAEGRVTAIRGQLAIMNPEYQLLPVEVDLPAWTEDNPGRSAAPTHSD